MIVIVIIALGVFVPGMIVIVIIALGVFVPGNFGNKGEKYV